MKLVFTCLLDQVSCITRLLFFRYQLNSSMLSIWGFSQILWFFTLQVSQYITDGLERAREGLNEAAALRERFVIGTIVSRRVAAAAATAVR